MINTINQSFREIYDIVLHMDKELYNKIPKAFIEMIKQNMDQNFKINIDYSKSINEQTLLQETRVLLSIIYRDYLCLTEEKMKLIEEDKLEIQCYQQELNKIKMPYVKNTRESFEKPTQLIEYKESTIKRIVKKILDIFHIN